MVHKKGTVLVGFHGEVELRRGHALQPSCRHVSDCLLPLRGLIASMDRPERLPQIELAASDRVTALVLRHLEPLSDADLERLRAFAEASRSMVAQPGGPDSAVPLDQQARTLSFALPEFGLRDRVPADQTSPRSTGDQPGPGRSSAAPARPAGRTSA